MVNITGHSNIAIVGNAALTTLACTGKSSGVYVAVVVNLKLANITFSKCSASFDSASVNVSNPSLAMAKVHVALYIINVTNVTIVSIHFHSSNGVGIAVYNTDGYITVTDCGFHNNTIRGDNLAGGGGMMIHYSYCTPGLITCDPNSNRRNSNNKITITSCCFEGNMANSSAGLTFHREKGTYTYGLGEGGGLAIAFSGNSSGNEVLLGNLHFRNNTALFGGGINILLKDSVRHNKISIADTALEANKAGNDGGALRVAIEFYDCTLCASNNLLYISNTTFVSNSAAWGGAIEFFSSHGLTAYANNIIFYNCTWDSNSAHIAAAVDVTIDAFNSLHTNPLPIPLFENCVFTNNILHSSQTGILTVQSNQVQFNGSVIFSNNTGTALYLTDATAVLLSGTVAEFSSNTASNGGAVALMGSSTLEIYPGTYLKFVENRALEFGGAIYFYSTNPSLFYSYTCFINYFNATVKPDNWENVEVWFINNTALGFGQAIYASTLLPCARAYGNGSSMEEKLHTVFNDEAHGPFHYLDPYTHGLIGTVPHQLDFESYVPLVAVPGKSFRPGVEAFDELGQLVNTVIHATVVNGSESARLASTYFYTADGSIMLTGVPGAEIELNLQTTGPLQIDTKMKVVLSHCPPGFYEHTDHTNSSICKCSAGVSHREYDGILRCDADDFLAVLSPGYWGGCLNRSKFVTGQCPLGFCNTTSQDVSLPQSCDELNDKLCGPKNRRGVLCGSCKENHTVHYHSYRYQCGHCKYPKLGLLFYVLAELLPLTIVFAVIVGFGVSFTSGPANSFIFFAQVLNFFDVTSFGSLQFPEAVTYLTYIYQPIFGAFNLDFFKGEALSFCLWETAQILDLLVFKYVTTLFVMAMLVVLILALHYIPHCHSCLQRCVFRRNLTICLIQGVSALLIISYAQCAKVSFEILTVQTLRGEGLHPDKSVVFLSGETGYLSYDHLPYAVPAILVLVLATIPPVTLILYPAFTKRCRKCLQNMTIAKTGEEEGISCLTTWNIRLVPFFDSFQGCFKDNSRYFAGLYFLYRFAIAMAFALSDNGMETYFTLEVIIIVVLALHSIVQPYKNRFFNVLDAAIFADLAIINGLSMYNFYWAQYGVTHTIAITSSIQVALIYLPLVYMVVMVLLKAVMRLSRVQRTQWVHRLNHWVPLSSEHTMEYRPLDLTSSFNENNLPARLFEEEKEGGRSHSNERSSYGATINSNRPANTV